MFFRLTLGSHEAALFPVDRFPAVFGSDLRSSLQARFPEKRWHSSLERFIKVLHFQRIE